MDDWSWSDFFDLDGKKISRGEWMEIWEDFPRRQVQRETLETEEVEISTVWLGTPLSGVGRVGDPRPLIFESMVFEDVGGTEVHCRRYASWMDAEYGHQELVRDAYAGRFRDAIREAREARES